MLCDDCYKAEAVMHMGHGILLCDDCFRNFDLKNVMDKMKERDMIITRLAEGEFIPFNLMKKVPVDIIMNSMSQ